MKALTLHQPWASLVGEGAKRWETRKWRTHYRGPLVIHAAKSLGPPGQYERAIKTIEPVRYHVLASMYDTAGGVLDLPRGALVAITWVEDCVRTEEVRDYLSDEEVAYGDYSPGRYAWKLREPLAFREVPCAGARGLWNVDDSLVPEEYRRAIVTPGLP